MNKVRLLGLCCAMFFLVALVAPVIVSAQDLSPLVSPDWVEKNLTNPKVRVIDIRRVDAYRSGHIPGAVNVFYGAWAIQKKGLETEVPEDDDLVDIIGGAGISADSWVVVASNVDTLPERMAVTRVAWTLIYAGVTNVALLDGGYNRWISEKKPMNSEIVKPARVAFKPAWNRQIMVSREYMASKIGKSAIIDTRMPEVFFGITKLDFVARFGHIKSAVCLPSAWLYTKDFLYIGKGDLEAMARGVAGSDKSKEVIIYCDTGRHASSWWFILNRVLGYQNVKLYDGSSQDWSKDASLPMVRYSWE